MLIIILQNDKVALTSLGYDAIFCQRMQMPTCFSDVFLVRSGSCINLKFWIYVSLNKLVCFRSYCNITRMFWTQLHIITSSIKMAMDSKSASPQNWVNSVSWMSLFLVCTYNLIWWWYTFRKYAYLPWFIDLFQSLHILFTLDNNRLTGTLPSALGELNKLTYLTICKCYAYILTCLFYFMSFRMLLWF